jgi:hypothetical protein
MFLSQSLSKELVGALAYNSVGMYGFCLVSVAEQFLVSFL